jgi:hypothetical protein
LRCFATPNFQIREQKLFLDFKNPWKILLKYNAEPRRGEAYLVQNSSQNPKSDNWRAKIQKVIIGGVFWTKSELSLNKIPTLNFNCRPAGDNPAQRFRPPPLRFGEQNRKIF